MSFATVFVCTGNVCRSPAAAAMATTWTRPGAKIHYSSAGLSALVGEPIDPAVAAALREAGVTPDGHRARQYAPWMALDSGLVLTATGEQSARILRDVPQALRRVFTIKEFARLATQAGTLPADLPAAVAAVAAMRGRVTPVDPDADDIRDPYRRGPDVVAEVVAELSTAVRAALTALGIASGPIAPRRRPLPYKR